MAWSAIWQDIARVGVSYFHEPQASENLAQECNITAILHDKPLNKLFILTWYMRELYSTYYRTFKPESGRKYFNSSTAYCVKRGCSLVTSQNTTAKHHTALLATRKQLSCNYKLLRRFKTFRWTVTRRTWNWPPLLFTRIWILRMRISTKK